MKCQCGNELYDRKFCPKCGNMIEEYDLVALDNNEIILSTEGLILKTALPVEDRLSKFNILYLLFAIAGAVFGLIDGNPYWYVMALFMLTPAFVIKVFIAIGYNGKLNGIEFNLPYEINYDFLAGIITIPLTHIGMTVRVWNGIPEITYKGQVYYITINHNGTFSLPYGKTLANSLIGGRRYITEYKKAIVALGLIAYTVQSIMVKEHVNVH